MSKKPVTSPDGIFRVAALDSASRGDDHSGTTDSGSIHFSTTTSTTEDAFRIEDEEQSGSDNSTAADRSTSYHDVPLGRATDVGTSFPSVEEIKSQQIHRRTTPKYATSFCRKNKKNILLFVALGVFLVSVIGVTLFVIRAVLTRNSASSGSTSSEHRKVDIQELIDYMTTTYDINFYPSNGRPNTPQYLAAKWMSQQDPANWELPTDLQMDYKYRFLARFVMAINYYAFGGPYWKNQLNFLSDLDICSWVGYVDTVSANKIELAGVFCDVDTGVPIDFSLFYNDLTGTIPSENGLLTTLKIFDVKYNEIGGTVPTEICQLTSLTSFFVGYNNMYGEIPDCIGNLQNMLRLFWPNNNFHGRLPSSMANLTNLERFIADDNLFTGDPIPIWQNMNSLNMLMMNDNELHGLIDSDFLPNHPNLTILDLSNNNFTSVTLPLHLFSMENLQVLDLSSNDIKATFAKPITNGTNDVLQFVSLYGNKLHGTIPSDINKLRNLVHIDLSNNTFSGPIPSEIGHMQNLTYLFLSNNPWLNKGSIPSWVSNLTSLTELSLRNTNRSGTLPSFVGTSMQQLVLLDLGWNKFTGSIPDTWGQLTELEFLLLNNNLGITDEVPLTMGNASQLRAVFVDGTNLKGSLDVLCNLPNFLLKAEGDSTESNDVIYANCLGERTLSGDKAIECSCCQCCNAKRETGCSNPYLNNLDASWERNFKRISYEFVNKTVYWDSTLFPNLA